MGEQSTAVVGMVSMTGGGISGEVIAFGWLIIALVLVVAAVLTVFRNK